MRQPTHGEGIKLQGVIGKIRRNLFVFVTNRDLAATNNESERSLRPCVTFRKITNGFRTVWGAELYADIRSVIETARRRAITPLQAIIWTLRGSPLPLKAA
jgi:transposase